ncbi:MAG: kaiC [bacterium]|nr:kaiC [bacterium]
MQDLQGKALTGIQGLDDVLCGGFPRNRIYLLQGDPGVGKTTLALSFLLEGAARGETCLYVTLSESKEEIDAVAASHGWSLDKVHVYELSAAEQSEHVTGGNTLFEPSEIELHEATTTLLEHVDHLQPSRVVIDSLSELRLLSQHPLRYRRQILSLKEYFVGRSCTVLMLDDRSVNRDDMQLESLAHGVVLLQQLAPEYGSDRRRLRVVKLRGVKFRGGYHDFIIETGGVVVFPRLVASEHHGEVPNLRLSSGLTELDQILGGGVDCGTSTLLIGPAGAGKSAIAVQYVYAAAQRGEKAALLLFEENLLTFHKRTRALGTDLQPHIDAGRVVVRQIDPAEVSPGELAAIARGYVDSGIRVMVIDSLNGYLNSMPEEKYLTIQLHEILTYMAQKGVATFLVVAQHNLVGAMNSPVDITYLADTVVLLRYFEADGRVRKALSVVKKRSGAHESTIREFALGANGIVVGKPLTGFRGVLTGVPTYVGETEELVGRT